MTAKVIQFPSDHVTMDAEVSSHLATIAHIRQAKSKGAESFESTLRAVCGLFGYTEVYFVHDADGNIESIRYLPGISG